MSSNVNPFSGVNGSESQDDLPRSVLPAEVWIHRPKNLQRRDYARSGVLGSAVAGQGARFADAITHAPLACEDVESGVNATSKARSPVAYFGWF
jgi:hypothetical protein